MIALDLSRLLSRAGRGTPTGIDRVELTYAEYFGRDEANATFVAASSLGTLGLLPRDEAMRFVSTIGTLWRSGGAAPEDDRQLKQLARRMRMASLANGERLFHKTLRSSRRPPVYLLVSHHHLEKPRIFERLKARS